MVKANVSPLKGNKDISIDDLAEQIDNLKNDLSSLTKMLSDLGAAKADDVTTAAKDKAIEAQLHAEEFVRTQPATSLGLAAGLGFLVGMITARR